VKSSLPLAINCGVTGSGSFIVIFSPWGSLLNLGEKFLIRLIRAQVSWADKASPQAGIEVPGTPLIMVLYKSSSLGRVPVGVDRNLKIPIRKIPWPRIKIVGCGATAITVLPMTEDAHM
jgi:hypothetical protein